MYLCKKIALKYSILDYPNVRPDKRQRTPIPFLGGLGFIITSSSLMSFLWLTNKFNLFDSASLLNQNLIFPFRLYWIIIAIGILTVGGILDDKYTLSSKQLSGYIIFAVLIAVFAGNLKIEAFSYPFNVFLPTFGFLPQALAFFWILACTAATKFLDGHDGLAATVSIIGLFSIASVSLFSNVFQPLIFLFALIWISGISSFLFFNFPEANLYLGESGAEVIGFIIGVLSILSGAKVATAGTVIGWFIVDFILVILTRYKQKKPLFKADRNHWHHRLVDLGLNKIQVLIATTVLMLVTAHLGLILPTQFKPLILLGQPIVLALLLVHVWRVNKNTK
ncbi:MAG: MraY family glycosyltransferase [Patescibacteria group bacterium]